MMPDTWTLEEAEQNFHKVAETASVGVPQYVNQPDKATLVLLTRTAYLRLLGNEIDENVAFADFLLSMPQGEPFLDENGRKEFALRDIEF